MALYLLQSLKGANIFGKLAFLFLFIAMLTGWLAYCTPNWGRSTDYPLRPSDFYRGYGVWRVGFSKLTHIGNSLHTDGWLLQWYGAFQACATFGFISLNVGFFLIILSIFVAPCKSNADVRFWNAINNMIGAVCWLVAVILFGVYFDDKFGNPATGFNSPKDHGLHYSFGLAVVTLLLQALAGVLLLMITNGGGAVRSSK